MLGLERNTGVAVRAMGAMPLDLASEVGAGCYPRRWEDLPASEPHPTVRASTDAAMTTANMLCIDPSPRNCSRTIAASRDTPGCISASTTSSTTRRQGRDTL